MSSETIMAAGYAMALILGAFVLEWLSSHTHRGSLRYRTAGFSYNEDHDHWKCPTGQSLWPHEYDHEKRIVRYRAQAMVCNACPIKNRCTDSDRGREIVRAVDPWPHSEAGRFHRGISLMLVGLALMIICVEAVRNHDPNELVTLCAVLIPGLLAWRWLARDLRRHPANFPATSGSQGLRLVTSGGDGERNRTIWAARQSEK